jgi:hypothetical protein
MAVSCSLSSWGRVQMAYETRTFSWTFSWTYTLPICTEPWTTNTKNPVLPFDISRFQIQTFSEDASLKFFLWSRFVVMAEKLWSAKFCFLLNVTVRNCLWKGRVPRGERVQRSGVAELPLLVVVLWELVSCLGVRSASMNGAVWIALTSAVKLARY